ncbi:beta-1,6-N-acetylglucosaminyltransferase [Prevotella sp. FD3004]|uniref:beta-1,6-N-acetylglucosaminyltransferase n=1 Tax=Prevotella sp. FD3004 TaxID=1408309 RepID=UPI0009DDC6C5|nr:beta-1,6-N-acetylglucosaminyltransferase [Prevotella sp. FD3004]
MMKFSYLILAHGSFHLLKELLTALDSPDNDIYVHMDLKVQYDEAAFLEGMRYSKVCFLKNRVKVRWGHISIVEATMNLLTEAVKGDYDYIHLLSGVDFPIKSQSYIQRFFEENRGKEFVDFSKTHDHDTLVKRTIWRPFVPGRPGERSGFLMRVNGQCVRLQRMLHIHCISPLENLRTGSQWFSITKSLAEELVNQKERILKRYRHVFIPDEMFLQTFLYENKYMDRVYNPDDERARCCRYIDWDRGEPYVWQDDDFRELVNSPYLWARKFSEANLELVRRIKKYIS